MDEYQLEVTDPEKNRTAEHTKIYADLTLKVAREMDVACVDLWGLFMRLAGWKAHEGEVLVGDRRRERSEVLEVLLRDGLHFNPAAYKLLFEATMNLIREKWPDEDPELVPFVHPWWRTLVGKE